MNPLAPLLLLAAVQAPPAGPAGAEGRAAARAILEQLFSEDDKASLSRNYSGRDEARISTRPRGSNHGGICEIHSLRIERDSAGAIRSVETDHWFLVLTGPGGEPQWSLKGEKLEKNCAGAGWSGRWFQAPEAFTAEAAVVGLLGLKAELAKPDPVAGTWGCRKRSQPCPDPKVIAERIDPLVPQGVAEGGHGGVPCPEGKYCVAVTLQHTDCDNWVAQLRLERTAGFRFHSARAAYRLGILHCGDPEMNG